MDQDSFRQLLHTSHSKGSAPLGAASGSRGAQLKAPTKKKPTGPTSQPTFKPRNVKKAQESKYRDRAAERRHGDGNDYAHVEAVLEDFEKRNADEDRDKVEAQRKYLGGDSEHSILVKGLDFALLEQNKAKSMLTNEDVDALDQAFMESSSYRETHIPKKRTREDLLRELKEQRTTPNTKNTFATKSEEVSGSTEQTILKGKFKPIGQSDVKKKKSRAETMDVEKKKKKKKRKMDTEVDGQEEDTTKNIRSLLSASEKATETPQNAAEQQIIDDDFDIFAGAGEYEGVNMDEDDEDDNTRDNLSSARGLEKEEPFTVAPRRWIESEEPDVTPTAVPIETSSKPQTTGTPRSPRSRFGSEDEDVEDGRPVPLIPLSSSVLPSIKDFLEMDKAADSYEKKKKRKEKKKTDDGSGDEGPKKRSMEAKVDRDYQRLKSYTEKKATGGNR